MAQYIQTPGASYQPLPMEAYMQLAKEVAAGYAEGINSANAYLSSLPIATGALDDPNGVRAAGLRDKYGSEVENAIQLYMDTKDKRSLASALTNVTRKMQSDEQLLAHNYLAANADNIVKRHQDNPNGWFGYTKDGTSALYTEDEQGNRVSNIIQNKGGLGDAKNFYGNYLSSFDIANDTKWIDSFGTHVDKIRSEGVYNPVSGRMEYIVGENKYSNIMDAFKGDATNEFMNSAKTLYDSGSNAMARLYRQKYGYEEGLKKFIDDTFKYRYPMEYSSGMDYDSETLGSTGLGTGNQTDLPSADMYSFDVFANTLETHGSSLSPEVRSSVDELFREIRRREQTENKTVMQILEEDLDLANRYEQAQSVLMSFQLEDAYKESEKGKKEYQQHLETVNDALSEDENGFWKTLQKFDITADELSDFYAKFEVADYQNPGKVFAPSKSVTQMLTDRSFEVFTPEALNFIADYQSMGEAERFQRGSIPYRNEFQSNRYDWYNTSMTQEEYFKNTPLQVETLRLGDLIERGILDPNSETDQKFIKLLKQGALRHLAYKKTEGPSIGIGMGTYKTPYAFRAFDDLFYEVREDEMKETPYIQNLTDYMTEANITSGETLIEVESNFQQELDSTEGQVLAQDLKTAATDPDGVFFQNYHVYRIDQEDVEGTSFKRAKTEKVTAEDPEILENAVNKKGESQVRITGYSIPYNDKLRAGLAFTIGETKMMIVPKDPNNTKYTGWLQKYKTTMSSAKTLSPYVVSGPFIGKSGQDVLDYATFHNSIAESGVVSLGTPSKEVFGNRFNKFLDSTTQMESRSNAYLDDAIPVFNLDDSDLVSQFNSQTGEGSQSVNLNVGYGYKKEDGSNFTWGDYFAEFDTANNIGLREAHALARSLEITDDLDPIKVNAFLRKVDQEIRGVTDDNGITHSVITASRYNELFSEVFGTMPNLNSQIRFTDVTDAITFYGFNPDDYRGK